MISDRTIRRDRLVDRGGSALVITMLLLVILTAIGIYAVSISTTEMNLSLNSRVGAVTRNVAESGAFFGIEKIPGTTYPGPFWTVFPPLTVGTNMTAAYEIQSDVSGSPSIQPGYGVNFRFVDVTVWARINSPPSGFETRARVDAVVNYGPIPSGTGY